LILTACLRIVLGNVNGQLQAAFTKVSGLHAKNGFSLALVTGNLFAEEDEAVANLLAGKIPIPLPTYFTVGSTPLPKSIIEKIEKDEEVSITPVCCTSKYFDSLSLFF